MRFFSRLRANGAQGYPKTPKVTSKGTPWTAQRTPKTPKMAPNDPMCESPAETHDFQTTKRKNAEMQNAEKQKRRYAETSTNRPTDRPIERPTD